MQKGSQLALQTVMLSYRLAAAQLIDGLLETRSACFVQL